VISGVSIGLIGLGMLMIVAGTHRSPLVDVLKAVLKGQPLPQDLWDQDPTLTKTVAVGGTTASLASLKSVGAGGSVMGQAVAAKATTYVGVVPYKWAGATPAGWDCSGLATWVLHHDFGIQLPSNTHTVTGGFLVWSGAHHVPKGQEAPGDVVVWPAQALFPDGHMGIVVNPGSHQMVAAADPQLGTILDTYNVGLPVFLRPDAYGQGAAQ
jgi:cell wall-associated NlpC family hydrolase